MKSNFQHYLKNKEPFLVVIVVIAIGLLAYSLFRPAMQENEGSGSNNPSSGLVLELTASNFNQVIQEGVVLVDFWAEWCMACRLQGPIVEEVAVAIGEKAIVAKMDFDRNQEIAFRYNARALPLLIIFKDGEPVRRFTGVTPKETLLSEIKELL